MVRILPFDAELFQVLLIEIGGEEHRYLRDVARQSIETSQHPTCGKFEADEKCPPKAAAGPGFG